MAEYTYPAKFHERVEFFDQDLDDDMEAASDALAEKGFLVVAGITPEIAPFITGFAHQEGIREFCPNDTDRFGSVDKIAKWLAKNGGRGMFLLMQVDEDEHMHPKGYGWTGYEKNNAILGYDVTFALRLSEEVAGQGLGAPFTEVITRGSAQLYGADKIALETWNSNFGARKSYERAGYAYATDVRERTYRPTAKRPGDLVYTDPANGQEYYAVLRDVKGDGNIVPAVLDERRYMYFPEEKFAA